MAVPRHARLCLLLSLAAGAAGRATLSTGGPLMSDWHDRYPGCRTALYEAQMHREPGSYVPLCASQFEQCSTEAKANANEGERLFALCRCLGKHKECVRSIVETIAYPNGTLIAPLHCPEVMYSRMCTLQEERVRLLLSFDEDATWSCPSCLDSTLNFPPSCVEGLRHENCLCHFSCPEDYELPCDGYRCHSISCLLALMNCWVADNDCRYIDAWYLCLYDQSLVAHNSDNNEYGPTVRDLGCRLDRCREAITHLDPSAMQAYTWIGMYALILILGVAVLWVTHSRGRSTSRRLNKEYNLGTSADESSVFLNY